MQSRNIFVFGLPRAGTTWLGKIFDSHPDTLFRHEPDAINSTNDFPFVIPSKDIEKYVDSARKYLIARVSDRQLRCVATTPFFRKSYRSEICDRLRNSMIAVAKTLNSAMPANIERRVNIPDMVSKSSTVVNVIKSVDSTARLPLFARACPREKFLYIMRHPCGVVNSKIRGDSLGKIPPSVAFRAWLDFDYALENKLTEADLKSWSDLEIAAWGWILVNDLVIKASRNHSNINVINYDALCASPIEHCKSVFAWCDLEWHPQTEEYIHDCMSNDPGSNASYYSTQQNPATAANKWKKELTPDQIEIVMAICSKTSACDPYIEE